MTDGRRAQWFAMDIQFLHGKFGADMLDKFGPTGTTLFVGFLGKCKQGNPEGQITYTSEGDALVQMGVATLDLVNSQGEPWTLDEFWTWCGQRKQTRRTYYGRLTTVQSAYGPKVTFSEIQRRACTPALRRKVMDRDGDKCAACGETNNPQVDHIMPIYLGGTSTADNLQILCQPCNASKGAQHPEEWEGRQ